jgi:hypothetical protein
VWITTIDTELLLSLHANGVLSNPLLRRLPLEAKERPDVPRAGLQLRLRFVEEATNG